MANITNDAWFGETSGPWQHLGMLPLRAVEQRVAIARAANTGVSAFVDADRADRSHAAPAGARRAPPPHRRSARRLTLYARLGDWLVYACAAVGLAGAGIAFFRRSPATC